MFLVSERCILAAKHRSSQPERRRNAFAVEPLLFLARGVTGGEGEQVQSGYCLLL